MPSAEHLAPALIERHSLRWLLLLYSLFILYGTFIPFEFSGDAVVLQSQLTRFFRPPFANGVRQFSLADMSSNILLFVPFGFLWVGSDIGKNIFSRLWAAFFVVGLLGGLFGLAIEIGQLFSPGRIPSLLDALCNGSGAAIGGLFACSFFRLLRGRLGNYAIAVLNHRPSLLLLALYLAAYAVDAFYPFDVTLDVSTVWHNVKYARWIPFTGGVRRYWPDLIVEKVMLFAAIGYLARGNLKTSFVANRGLGAWWLCVAASLAIEMGKLLFSGRSPNVENFMLSSFGALLGVVLAYPLATTALCRRHAFAILLSLTVLVAAWAELSPLDWVGSVAEWSTRAERIEWLPLTAYYHADPRLALFDLLKKLLLVGPFGFLLAMRTHRISAAHPRLRATVAGLVLGALFEAAQIGVSSRTASSTDVLLFGLASWFGAFACERFLRFSKLRGRVCELHGI
ncbi:MAG: VanZ family protein [Candidatus Binatia bacterium]